jgi:hypothetical protein
MAFIEARLALPGRRPNPFPGRGSWRIDGRRYETTMILDRIDPML